MEWQTEKLTGWICFRKLNKETIYSNDFEIPASEMVGKHANRNILSAAGVWRPADARCVRHFVSYPIVLGQLIPSDHLIFRWKDISDIECEITLDAHTPAKFRLEREEDSQLALEEMRKNHLDTLCLEFYPSPERIIEEIDQVTELRYLALDSSFAPSIFQTIGRLSHLRGLQLDRRERFYIKKRRKNGKQSLELTLDEDAFPEMIFDRAAVTELCKLENFQVLALRNFITITDDALMELGALKNLKALYLNLSSHEFADKSACVEALSFLKKLDKLEYLNITTRHPHSRDRLMRRDLELPTNLKYLVLEGKVHRFHSAPAKPLVKLSVENGALVCRFKEKEAFRIAGDGATPESRQQLVATLREMLLKLPPKDGANIVEHGIAVDFDAPDLAKLIETELAIKVIRHR